MHINSILINMSVTHRHIRRIMSAKEMVEALTEQSWGHEVQQHSVL